MSLQGLREVSLRFAHAYSWISEPRTELLQGVATPPECGVTVWADDKYHPLHYLLWQWTSVKTAVGGVIGIYNPAVLETNMELLGPDGEPLTATRRVRELNVVIHGLPWIQFAEDALVRQIKPPIDRRNPSVDLL